MSQKSPSSSLPSVGGIHISRGVTLRIPTGGLVIHTGSGNGPRMEVAVVELQLDTCIHWLEIALEHLAAAGVAHEALASPQPNEANVVDLLDREFKSAVQAVVAAATFFEALYAATVERVPTKHNPSLRTSQRRSARYARVTEQLKQSFGLKNQSTANLRSVLSEVYRFRDEAVHPSAAFSQPILHPLLQVGVERRFVMFSYGSAQQLVRAALAFSKILPSRNLSRRPKAIQEFAAYLLQVCAPLYAKWEHLYGPLLDEAPNAMCPDTSVKR